MMSFSPSFPIIDLDSSLDDVVELMSSFGQVYQYDSVEQNIDYELVIEGPDFRISVGCRNDVIAYVNYLSDQCNESDLEKEGKFDWFVAYYGGKHEFSEVLNTGYMLMANNESKAIGLVLGLHMGPVRVNKLKQMPN